jgi:RNA polymerase sigma factor (TIGR02999 family)
VDEADFTVNQGLAALIARAESGDASAADALFAALYSELHGLASQQLARSAGWLTLGTTTLLHEAYLNINRRDGLAFPDRAHFMAYASRVMRGLLIDYVRARKAQKRGGEFQLGPLTDDVPADPEDGEHLARIGAAIDELAQLDPSLAQVVDLKFFCGFGFAEIAAMRGVSERTVQRHWEKARALLRGLIPD